MNKSSLQIIISAIKQKQAEEQGKIIVKLLMEIGYSERELKNPKKFIAEKCVLVSDPQTNGSLKYTLYINDVPRIVWDDELDLDVKDLKTKIKFNKPKLIG